MTICSYRVKANHIWGGEIQVDVLKPDTFVVMMTVFRECGGAQTDSTETIAFYSYGCSPVKSANATIHLRKTDKADFICADSMSSCAGGTFPYGIQARIYIDTFYTAQLFPSGVSCCDLFVFYESCCRNAQVSPPFPGKFHFETKFNRCIQNRAPRFTNYPKFVIKSGFYFNNSRGIIDTMDVDSFSFEEVAPLTGHDTDLASPFWSADNPIYLGYPNKKNYPCPAGYSYNKATNDWYFTAHVTPFQQSLAFEIKEWRKIAGTFTNISTIRREILISNPATPPVNYFSSPGVQLSTNLPLSFPYRVGISPYCYGPNYNYFQTKVGQPICFYLKAVKNGGTDSVKINWNGGLPGAVFNSLNQNGYMDRGDSASICWTPDFKHNKETPFYFTFMVKGQECPIPSEFSQTILVRVNNFYLTRSITRTGVGVYKIIANVPSVFSSALVSYKFSQNQFGIFDSANAAAYSTNPATHAFTQNGKYVVRTRFIYPAAGVIDYYDTITICDFAQMAQVGSDTALCKNNFIKLAASPPGGVWSGIILQHDTFSATTAGNYILVYTIAPDTFGCPPLRAADTLQISVHNPPLVTSNADTVLCEQAGWVPLRDSPPGGIWTAWGLGMNGNLFNGNQNPGPYQAFYSYTDSNGCSNADTTKISIIHAVFTPSVSYGQAPLFVSFSNTSDSIYTDWLWNFGNGPSDTSSQKNPQYTFLMSNRLYAISLVATSSYYHCSTTVYGSVSTSPNGSFHISGKQMEVYPNPANEEITISAEGIPGTKQIKLTDMSGRIILETSAENTPVILSLGHISKGIYMLFVTGRKGKQRIQKLVVE
ncbi:MAG: T9SS type A sorting domain-containing protein [Bacteroidia bacterium]|nr:T9SS type A sorting domain-containing protein [Bacteroidia bacterium]